MGILGQLFAHGVEGMDEVRFRPSRKVTRKDVSEIAERAAEAFRSDNLNVLSCYEIEGEFGLWSTLGNFAQTKGAANSEISEAVSSGDEIGLLEAFRRALGLAFVALVEKNALKRIQLVHQWPPEALAEYARLRTHVKPEDAPKPQPQPQARPVGSETFVPVETPVETCAREFRELPSAAWQAKWFRDQRNRPLAEQAAAEGKI